MKPPIVINDSSAIDDPGDLRVYDSIEAAKSSLEIDDVGDPHLFIFDSEGRRLTMFGSTNYTVGLLDADERPQHRDVLVALLRAHLKRSGHVGAVDDLSLEQLLAASYSIAPNPYA